MEANRIWQDPVVEIYGNLITPRVGYAAEAYDLANRRWYRLEVTEHDVPDDEWLADTVAEHVRAYHETHGGQVPPWNTIKMTARHGGATTYEARPDEDVARPIRESLSYGSGPTDRLPTTSVDELHNLSYISRSADRCLWRGQDCVFKRIEFDVDIEVIEAEIRVRETLIEAIVSGDSSSSAAAANDTTNVNEEMTRRFLVVPILAVAIGNRKPWAPNTVAGVLMPFAGRDLETLTQEEAENEEAGSETPLLDITLSHLRDLVSGVRELGKVGVQHGDIKYWNTVLQPLSDGASRLVLIDAGTEAPEYEGDAKALQQLFYWCLENARGLEGSRDKVLAAMEALGDGDFEAALEALSTAEQ